MDKAAHGAAPRRTAACESWFYFFVFRSTRIIPGGPQGGRTGKALSAHRRRAALPIQNTRRFSPYTKVISILRHLPLTVKRSARSFAVGHDPPAVRALPESAGAGAARLPVQAAAAPALRAHFIPSAAPAVQKSRTAQPRGLTPCGGRAKMTGTSLISEDETPCRSQQSS